MHSHYIIGRDAQGQPGKLPLVAYFNGDDTPRYSDSYARRINVGSLISDTLRLNHLGREQRQEIVMGAIATIGEVAQRPESADERALLRLIRSSFSERMHHKAGELGLTL